MTKGIALYEFESRDFGATKTPIGARALTDVGKVNSMGREVCRAVSILETMRASASDVKEQALTKGMRVGAAMEPDIGTSIMVGDKRRKNETSVCVKMVFMMYGNHHTETNPSYAK